MDTNNTTQNTNNVYSNQFIQSVDDDVNSDDNHCDDTIIDHRYTIAEMLVIGACIAFIILLTFIIITIHTN